MILSQNDLTKDSVSSKIVDIAPWLTPNTRLNLGPSFQGQKKIAII